VIIHGDAVDHGKPESEIHLREVAHVPFDRCGGGEVNRPGDRQAGNDRVHHQNASTVTAPDLRDQAFLVRDRGTAF
jgi:hypothetical protein